MPQQSSHTSSHRTPHTPNDAPNLGHRARIAESVDRILAERLWQPAVAIILGSGLGPLAEQVEHASSIPYEAIPHFCRTHAQGHRGQLVLGYLAGVPVVLMQGRAHRYEGFANHQVDYPVHIMHALGARVLITTNAAGGLNTRFAAGDLMVIDSHIDFLWSRGMWDANSQSSRETPHRTPPYDWQLIRRAKAVASQNGILLQQGSYLATLGPTYETRSEYRMFRWTGADAVGMSTIPEALAAQQLGMRTLAFSVITNVASTDTPQATSHHEVVELGNAAGPRLLLVITSLLHEMAGQPD